MSNWMSNSGKRQRRPLNLLACEEAYRKQQRRYRRAIDSDNRRKIHGIMNWLLKSYSAKVVALDKAARKKHAPRSLAKLDMAARMLSCWEQPNEQVRLYAKRKANGDRRPIFAYGVMRSAQQYLVLGALEPRLRLHPGQYSVPGRNQTAALEAVKRAIAAGYHWVIRGDIEKCYPSMNGEKTLANLPGPIAVLRQVILSPPGRYIMHSYMHASPMKGVRRGLPQGAASTSAVAAAALAPIVDQLAKDAVVISYVDDFALFTRSKAAAAEAMNTLQKALAAAPVGNLQLKFCEIGHATEGFGFLGYDILLAKSGMAIARPQTSGFEGLDSRLSAVTPWEEKVRDLWSWRCSYAAWDGDEYGDTILATICGHHFPIDVEDLLRVLHLRARKTKLKAMRACGNSGV